VAAHGTAVGRAVLAGLPQPALDQLLTRAGITDLAASHRELPTSGRSVTRTTTAGQEVGVRCIAVAVPGAPAGAAISISGPVARMSTISVADVVPLMHRVAADLAREIVV
jgi:IclR family transcriptional regulator, acetate operon repressor